MRYSDDRVKVCALTQLPIKKGEEMVVVPIFETSRHDRNGPTSLWAPGNVSWYAKYDGIVAATDSDGIFMESALSHIKANARVKNRSYSSSVYQKVSSDSSFTVNDFYNYVSSGSIRIEQRAQRKVDYVGIKQSALVSFGETMVFTRNSKSAMVDYRWVELFSAIPAFATTLCNYVTSKQLALAKDGASSADTTSWYVRMAMSKLNNTGESKYDEIIANHLEIYLRYDSQSYRMIDVFSIIAKFIDERNVDAVAMILEEVMRLAFIECLFDVFNKVWAPSCHEGETRDSSFPFESMAILYMQEVNKEVKEREEAAKNSCAAL